jgi:hypothetical protein
MAVATWLLVAAAAMYLGLAAAGGHLCPAGSGVSAEVST